MPRLALRGGFANADHRHETGAPKRFRLSQTISSLS